MALLEKWHILIENYNIITQQIWIKMQQLVELNKQCFKVCCITKLKKKKIISTHKLTSIAAEDNINIIMEGYLQVSMAHEINQ